MSYNTDLQTNNTSLQEILATINNLPEAGGSGSSGGGAEWIDVKSLPFKGSGNCTTGLIGNFYDCTSYMNSVENFALVVRCKTNTETTVGLIYLLNAGSSLLDSSIVTFEEDMYGASICLVENGIQSYITEAYMLVIPK